MQKNLITSAILLSLSTVVLANETTEQVAQLDEIKVYSAYAAPVNQDKTASSVTVLTEKDFAQRNATYVSDVLKSVAGITFSSSGGRGSMTNMFIRGSETKHISVIIDGVKVNPLDGNGFNFGGLSLSNVDRIEVLRGEQSTLWGSNAMGGVIYITTKSGLYKDKGFNVDFDFGGGSKKTSDGSVTISGHSDGFYYSLHGDSHHTRSISTFSKDAFNYTSLAGDDFSTGGMIEKDKFHSDNVSAKFGYDNGNKGIELFARHSTQTKHFDETTYGRSETLVDDYTREKENTFKLGGYLGNEQELFKQRFSISHIKTDSDTFSTQEIYGENYEIDGFEPSHRYYDGKKLNTTYQLDVNFDRDGDLTQAISFLGEYHRDEYNSSMYSESKVLAEKALAVEYRLFHENDHSLSFSGRYVDHSQIKSGVVGRVSGAFRISPNFRVHGSFGSALRNPTIIDYFGYSNNYQPNSDLKAEQSKGGDIGLLIESNDRNHSLDMTYFARNVENYINYEQVSCGEKKTCYRSTNTAGITKIKGIEIAYNGKLTDMLSIYANYTYTDAKNSSRERLVRRPTNMANAGINYQFTEQASVNTNISYIGKRYDNYWDEKFSQHRTKMPSYTLVNLGTDYQLNSNLKVYVNLNNVFNKKYENIISYGQYGRNVYVGLKGSF